MFSNRILQAVLFLFSVSVFGQPTETERLLERSESIVLYDPNTSLSITQHILTTSQTEQNRGQAYYLNGLANYVLGAYDRTLKNAFASKNLAEKENDTQLLNKSNSLISSVLKRLRLIAPDNRYPQGGDFGVNAFMAEEDLMKGNEMLLSNKLDSANYLFERAHSSFKSVEPGIVNAQYYSMMGKWLFRTQKLDSANTMFHKALNIIHQIDNPFIKREIYQNMATNYLALDSLAKFQETNQNAQDLDLTTEKIETSAANLAHTLITDDLDKEQLELKRNYSSALKTLLVIFCVLLMLRVVFFVRNRNKLKMYNNLLRYLEKQEMTQQEDEQVEMQALEESTNKVQRPTLLKESENQILQALNKFESTKKFTNKDMSLSTLASQLNTNTKYLSEVINRHKQKNFNAYINELRINYITEKIKTDPNYINYKVSYLAEESGFSSHSTFTTVFKSIVGVSPIMFVEFVKEEREEKLKPVFNE